MNPATPIPAPSAPRTRYPRLRSLGRWAMRAAATLLAALAGAWIGGRAQLFLFESPYFQARDIHIEGIEGEAAAALSAQLESIAAENSLFLLSPERLRARLLSAPGLRDIEVRRKFPNRLEITARERHPAAILLASRTALLDLDLHVIAFLEPEEFLNSPLPILTAEPEPVLRLGETVQDGRIAGAWRAVSILQRRAPQIAARLSQTHCDAAGGLTLFFEGGAEVRLGVRPLRETLPVLEALWLAETELRNVEYVDLRNRNQAVLKLQANAAPQAPARNIARVVDGENH